MTTVTVLDADTLTACISRVLAAILDAADALPDAVPLPERRIITTAGATWDCPMVYVSALSVAQGLPEPTGVDLRLQGQLTYPPSSLLAYQVSVEAGIVRKVLAQPTVAGPAQRSPAPDLFAQDLAAVSSDTAVLFNAAATLTARDVQPVPTSASMLASSGGFHGAAATFTVEPWPVPS
jgi:hypothetical protein